VRYPPCARPVAKAVTQEVTVKRDNPLAKMVAATVLFTRGVGLATAKMTATLFSHPIKFFGGLGKLLAKPKGASALTKPPPKA